MNRRDLMGAALAAAGTMYVPGLARANPLTLRKASGFRYAPAADSPFSSGVIAMEGYMLSRFRFRSVMPLTGGLAAVSRIMNTLGCTPNALAGLELRAPQRMTRPGFAAFNRRYLTCLKQAGFLTDAPVSIARSTMVPEFDPPSVDTLVAFTISVQQKSLAVQNTGADFLTSGRPEHASNPDRVVAAGDSSAAGMDAKARFVWGALRQTIADLGGHWSDISGTQIYMTEPLERVLPATREAGLLQSGLTLFPGQTPVIGFGDSPYAFEADVRAISREEIL